MQRKTGLGRAERSRPSLVWVTAVGLFALVVFSGTAEAQSPRVMTLWASGRIARFDPVAHVLVIRQGAHEMTFAVRGETRLEHGQQPEPPTELVRDVGRDVRINYVTVSGTRIARRVVLVIVNRQSAGN